jgi:predicted RNase H-like HicB family nuclease
MKNLSFEIEKDGDQYHTWCPELPGCHTHGKIVSEAMENLKDAVHLYLDFILEEDIGKKSLELAS